MAKKLNLKFEAINDGGLRVSWDDPVLAEFSLGQTLLYAFGVVAIIIVSIAWAILNDGIWPIGVGLVAILAATVKFYIPTMQHNEVLFGRDITTHNGRQFPTAEITRFEYGLRSQLTGEQPQRDGHGRPMTDPMMIRLWVNDAVPYEISMNNWQYQVNHEIRDALARALDQVRANAKQEDQDREFGETSGDQGMPEY